jgi:hypothetical protein
MYGILRTLLYNTGQQLPGGFHESTLGPGLPQSNDEEVDAYEVQGSSFFLFIQSWKQVL